MMEKVEDICAMIIPGYPMLYSWEYISTNSMSIILSNKSINFSKISQITLFLLPNAESKIPIDIMHLLYIILQKNHTICGLTWSNFL